MRCLPALLAITVAALLPSESSHAQYIAQDEIASAAAQFEAAERVGDWAVCQAMTQPSATLFNLAGDDRRSLLRELESQSKKANATRPTRLIARDVQADDQTAIVVEVFAAKLDVTDGTKVLPTRRSTTWLRDNGSWKIAHMHESEYRRWEPAISAFETSDTQARPEPGGVVFVGSSSIRQWNTLAVDFPDVNVLGRGFGGSQLIDSIANSHRIITAYHPRAVVIYAGDNDVAAGKSAERVVADFKLLIDTIHAKSPQARIGFIAIKPSLKRWSMWPKMRAANEAIAAFASQEPRVDFLDIAKPMLDEEGKPKPELFLKDGLHLTAAGYQVWTNVVRPWVNKVVK